MKFLASAFLGAALPHCRVVRDDLVPGKLVEPAGEALLAPYLLHSSTRQSDKSHRHTFSDLRTAVSRKRHLPPIFTDQRWYICAMECKGTSMTGLCCIMGWIRALLCHSQVTYNLVHFTILSKPALLSFVTSLKASASKTQDRASDTAKVWSTVLRISYFHDYRGRK